jgi:hypothetical protein
MELTRGSEDPGVSYWAICLRRNRRHFACLDCGAEQGEGGWEHVLHALPHVKFHGRPQDGPQGAIVGVPGG